VHASIQPQIPQYFPEAKNIVPRDYVPVWVLVQGTKRPLRTRNETSWEWKVHKPWRHSAGTGKRLWCILMDHTLLGAVEAWSTRLFHSGSPSLVIKKGKDRH